MKLGVYGATSMTSDLQAAKVALYLLGENVEDPQVTEPTIILHGQLKIRQSTAIPPSHISIVK